MRFTGVCALAALALLFAAATTPARCDVDNARETNYHTTGYQHVGLGQTDWDYVDFDKWPSKCRTGRRQSPISFANVDPDEVVTDENLRRLKFSSECTFQADQTKMQVTNNANIITVMFETVDAVPGDPSPCTVLDPLDKKPSYHFLGMHFHSNSEHKFNNIIPDAEMHLVFGTDEEDEKDQQFLELAVLLKASNTINSTSVRALRHILVEGAIPLPHTKTTCFLTEELSLRTFLPPQENYLAYDGSNTFPPCTENIRWVVMTSPVLISRLALAKLRDALDETMPNDFHRFGNARPPQPLNGRRIYRFKDDTNGEKEPEDAVGLKDVWKKSDTPHAATPVKKTGALTAEEVRVWALITGDDSEEDSEEVVTASSAAVETSQGTDKQGEANLPGGSSGSNGSSGGPKKEKKGDADHGASSVTDAIRSSSVGSLAAKSSSSSQKSSSSVVKASLSSSPSPSSAPSPLPFSSSSSSSPSLRGAARSADDGAGASASSVVDLVEVSLPVSVAASTHGEAATHDPHAVTHRPTATPTTKAAKSSTKHITTTTPKPSEKRSKARTTTTEAPTSKLKSAKGNSNKSKETEESKPTGVWGKVKHGASVAKHKLAEVTNETVDFIYNQSKKTILTAIAIMLVAFTIVLSCRRWRHPTYVAGVSPEELQHLSPRGTAPGSTYGTSTDALPPMP